ncbi:MAG: hypothetical protein KF895_03800 [Parvibaculum sp.]|nr:hypothetical protein [Parvibaculum sp.]
MTRLPIYSPRRLMLTAAMFAVAGGAALFVLLGATPAHACATGGNYNFNYNYNSNTNVNVNSNFNSNSNSNSTSVTIRHSVSG